MVITGLPRIDRRNFLSGLLSAGLCGCIDDDGAAAEVDTGDAAPEALSAPGLHRGINLSWWLNLTGQLRPSDDELEGLREAGFDHVRLPVDPFHLDWSPDDEDLPKDTHRLDAAVDKILKAGLNLILDIHPGDRLNERLARRDAAPSLARLWDLLAERYGDYPPERMVFELVNEPHRFLDSRSELARLHRMALAAIRRTRPSHRVVVNGLFDPRSSLQTIMPLPDVNVIYGFQFYDPYVVTHQGADWDDSADLEPLRGVPYPSSTLDHVDSVVQYGWLHRRALRAVRAYSREGWDADRLDRIVGRAAAWSVAHQAPILCEEFGATRRYIDKRSRLAWLTDARSALERHRIPWTVWELDGVFGVTSGCRGELGTSACRRLEPAMRRALGLNA